MHLLPIHASRAYYNIISCLELQSDCIQCLVLPRRRPSLFLIICLGIGKYLNCGFCFIYVYDNILYCDNNIILGREHCNKRNVHSIECVISVTYILYMSILIIYIYICIYTLYRNMI